MIKVPFNKRGLCDESTKTYQKILEQDPSNREALCIIAADQFYNNDPVQSFSYYRRTLQSGTGKYFYSVVSNGYRL